MFTTHSLHVTMKRRAADPLAHVEDSEPPKKFARQQPSSCASCRKRKLKCDRADPCGNCSLRNLECVPAGKPQRTVAADVATEDSSRVRREEERGECDARIDYEYRRLFPTEPELMYEGPRGANRAASYSTIDSPVVIGNSASASSRIVHNATESSTPVHPLGRTVRTSEASADSHGTNDPATHADETHHAHHNAIGNSKTWSPPPGWSVGVPYNHSYRKPPLPSPPPTYTTRSTASRPPRESTPRDDGLLTPASSAAQSYEPQIGEPFASAINANNASTTEHDANIEAFLEKAEPEHLSRCALRLETDAIGMRPSTPGYAPETKQGPTLNLLFPSDHTRLRHCLTPITPAKILAILPSQAKANRLLDHYADCVSWAYHICHGPTLRQVLSDIYREASQNKLVDLKQLSLIAAVLGISVYYASKDFNMTIEQTNHIANELLQLSQRALLEVDYLKCPSLSTVQAMLILGYMIVPESGQMATTLLILRAAVHCAQSLGLHRIDSPREVKAREQKAVDHIQLEMARRTWWGIAASDWLLSTMSGPFTCTYTVHPSQTQVLLPSNLDDTSLDSHGAYPRPSSAFTDMSYCLARLRLSTIYREVVDTANALGLEIHDLDYPTVQRLDEKFTAMQAELPYFLQLDEESRDRTKVLERARPCVAWARTSLHCGLSIRRLQIHRRYLVLALSHPQYTPSRLISLSCARTVLALEREMTASMINVVPNFSHHWAIVHHVLVAALVLAMEYARRDDEHAGEGRDDEPASVGRDDEHAGGEKDSERASGERRIRLRGEIVEACRALGRSEGRSGIARRGVGMLRRVLRCWKEKSGKVDEGAERSVAAAASAKTAGDAMPMAVAPSEVGSRAQYAANEVHVDISGLPAPNAFGDLNTTDNTTTAGDFGELDYTLGEAFGDLWDNAMDMPLGLEQGEWDALFQEL